MTPFNRFKKDFEGKRVLIFGLGLLGRGASVAKLFAQIGCKVKVTDLKSQKQLLPSIKLLKQFSISYTLGKHKKKDVLENDIIIRNPAVPWNHPLLKLARKKNIKICMDSALFAKYFPGKIIGITGTRGKTTTTLLVHKLIKNFNKPTLLAGNAIKKANLSILKKSRQSSIAVMELSSWELQGFRQEKISPHIAVVTNIYHDHLNRYKKLYEYIKDKQVIYKFQSQENHLVLNKQNRWTREMAKNTKSRVDWFTKSDFPKNWKLTLLGEHNLENAAAALKVGNILKLTDESMKKTFSSFPVVEHRLEKVTIINGVTFINDTTSTTPVATIKALKTISSPLVLLAGGNSKNLPLDSLPREIAKNVKAVVLLNGDGTSELKNSLEKLKSVNIISQNRSLRESVIAAFKFASPGDVVLLSPGFTSFAEFANEFQRGDKFKQIVKEIQKSNG